MSANNVVILPNSKLTDTRSAGGHGDGPEGPMLEQRVLKVETDIATIRSDIATMKIGQRSIEDSLLEIKTELRLLPKAGEIGEIKGKLTLMPTTWQLVALLLTTWAAGMYIAIALMRLGKS
jgi:hypothetical protein